jgi:predicted transcriptional regulator
MFRFVNSLFGCAHEHCTFPITAKKQGAAPSEGKPVTTTYIVCLDCGKEFPYDWQQMKVVAPAKNAA